MIFVDVKWTLFRHLRTAVVCKKWEMPRGFCNWLDETTEMVLYAYILLFHKTCLILKERMSIFLYNFSCLYFLLTNNFEEKRKTYYLNTVLVSECLHLQGHCPHVSCNQFPHMVNLEQPFWGYVHLRRDKTRSSKSSWFTQWMSG